MRLINNTVFQVVTFDHWGQDEKEVSVVVVKAVLYRHDSTWTYVPGEIEIAGADVFDGDPATTALHLEQEIAPRKAATDLLIRATAYAPGDTPLRDWPVSVGIPERLSYGFQVRGPSVWTRDRGDRWHLSQPEPVRSVPIRYDLAYGGSMKDTGGTIRTFDQNPAGCGFCVSGHDEDLTEIAAPQIGLLAEFISAKFGDEMAVQGFGPIAKAWLPRRSYAGTLDDNWRATRHPRMPRDYDYRFWNAASGPLQLSPFLRGNERIVLRNLRPDTPEYGFELPGVAVMGRLQPSDDVVAFDLDTVSIDIEAEKVSDHTLSMIWRAMIPASDSIDALEIDMIAANDQTEEQT